MIERERFILAMRIVEKLIDNLEDRSGFNRDYIDDKTKKEWNDEWVDIVEKELRDNI